MSPGVQELQPLDLGRAGVYYRLMELGRRTGFPVHLGKMLHPVGETVGVAL